jgi:hypothetical protein
LAGTEKTRKEETHPAILDSEGGEVVEEIDAVAGQEKLVSVDPVGREELEGELHGGGRSTSAKKLDSRGTRGIRMSA